MLHKPFKVPTPRPISSGHLFTMAPHICESCSRGAFFLWVETNLHGQIHGLISFPIRIPFSSTIFMK